MMSFWNRPAWSSIKESATPEKKQGCNAHERPSDSSPLTDPPPSSVVDLTSDVTRDPGSQLTGSLVQSVGDSGPDAPAPEGSFQSIDSAAPPSSLTESFPASQRILKGGKEVVISSDGDETDSSLEDPAVLFAPKNQPKKPEPAQTIKPPPSHNYAPKKYKNSIAALAASARKEGKFKEDLQAAEEDLQKFKSTLSPGENQPGATKHLQEAMLVSAFGHGEDENGIDSSRIIGAVRRTEALEYDRAWRFLDQNQTPTAKPEFPRDLISPGSNIAALREPDSRVRILESGVLEFASSLHRLPDWLLRWLFHSIPFEPRDELRAAYCRVFAAQTSPDKVGSLIRPDDINVFFRALGARPQALDPENVIVEDPPEQMSRGAQLKDRAIFIATFDLFRDSFHLFADDTAEHTILILLRMTIDASLTADVMIRSELQSCLTCLLERVPEHRIGPMERRICTTLYETVKDAEFQIRVLQHILPTSTWISLLRYRLAVAFLLKDPTPLSEPPEKVLDLKRLAMFLVRDERFHLKLWKGKDDYDYGELIAIAMLLEIVLNSFPYDSECVTEQEFNKTIDNLALQIKKIFSSIENKGASHLKRLAAKDVLEALHYRVIFSVRSKPPPKKTPFKTLAKERDGDIKSHFKTRYVVDPAGDGANDAEGGTEGGAEDSAEGTDIPIRGHDPAP